MILSNNAEFEGWGTAALYDVHLTTSVSFWVVINSPAEESGY